MTAPAVTPPPVLPHVYPGPHDTWCWHCDECGCHECGWNHRTQQGAQRAWETHAHIEGSRP